MQIDHAYTFTYKGETRRAEIVEDKNGVLRGRLLEGDKSFEYGEDQFRCFTERLITDIRPVHALKI